jgi:hypothetical protein
MRHWGVTKGKKVGEVGLGGLGHMGAKFGHALGAQVVVVTTSPKKEDARRLGADEVDVSRNADEMRRHSGTFDVILDAVSASRGTPALMKRRFYICNDKGGSVVNLDAAITVAMLTSWSLSDGAALSRVHGIDPAKLPPTGNCGRKYGVRTSRVIRAQCDRCKTIDFLARSKSRMVIRPARSEDALVIATIHVEAWRPVAEPMRP